MIIAIMGVVGTGKTQLAQALKTALSCNAPPIDITVVAQWSGSIDPDVRVRGFSPFDLVLLTGLDLPEVTEMQQSFDNQLRKTLTDQGIPFVTVYGIGPRSVQAALQAITHHRDNGTPKIHSTTAWHWNCENCSDAGCERRLFSALVGIERSMQV
jgi:hypothetical protein